MKIVIGSDHGALELKAVLTEYLKEKGHEVEDVGTYTAESVDYPIYGEKVANAVAGGRAERGIALCGTGVGISISCNKVNGIRAVCCSEPYSAKLSRQHNDSNVLCMGGRVVGTELAKMIVDEWIGTSFLGGRHERRVNMLKEIEERN